MKKKLFVLPLTVLFLPAFLTGCNEKPASKYLSNQWFMTGYGSYINGKYHTTEGGVELHKSDITSNGYKETYVLENQELKIGDSIYFVNKNKSIRINKYEESESFTTKNVYLYAQNKKLSVDVLKTGRYNIELNVKDNSASISITNAVGTLDNLNPVTPMDQTISMFEHGDYHAAIYEKTTQVGLFKYASLIKTEMDKTPEDDLLLSNGDFWQGNYESNVNKGEVLSKITDALEYDCFNLGNHEFDWGQDNIYKNQGLSNTPFIGCNIVNYKTKELVDYVAPYVIVERGDVKIGVLGGIGPAQWTSICSDKVSNIEFGDLEEYGKIYADRLRSEFGCHVVVFNVHNPTTTKSSTFAGILSKVSPVTNQRYVDAFFFGHDHDPDYGTILPSSSKVPFCNSGNNGVALSHINLSLVNGVVDTSTSSSELIYPNADELAEDAEIKTLFNNLVPDEVHQKAMSVVGTASATFSDSAAGGMMSKAIYDYVSAQGSKIDLVVVNSTRALLTAGEVTYSEVTDSFPFFNDIVVLKVSGVEARSLAKGNNQYHPKDVSELSTITIATYDYLALHMSQNREYDYFTNPKVSKRYFKYPSDILTDYWSNLGGSANPSDYLGENYQ